MEKNNYIDADKYIELGFILKRSRSAENEKKVLEILNMDISITEKKNMIEKLDSASREQRIKERFAALVNGELDQKISIHINTKEKEISPDSSEIKKDYAFTNILLVDDLTYITKTVSYMLQKENFKVWTAKNGAEGLILFQNLAPDLVITDVRLPDFNGIEMVNLIRKLDETVPVIFITAIDMNAELQHYDLSRNRMAFLLKPILKDDLLDTIKKLINEK